MSILNLCTSYGNAGEMPTSLVSDFLIDDPYIFIVEPSSWHTFDDHLISIHGFFNSQNTTNSYYSIFHPKASQRDVQRVYIATQHIYMIIIIIVVCNKNTAFHTYTCNFFMWTLYTLYYAWYGRLWGYSCREPFQAKIFILILLSSGCLYDVDVWIVIITIIGHAWVCLQDVWCYMGKNMS